MDISDPKAAKTAEPVVNTNKLLQDIQVNLNILQ